MKRRFKVLCDQILNALWEENPVEATYLGIHHYDSVLPRTDDISRKAYREQKQSFLPLLAEFEARRSELDLGEQLDLELLKSNIEASLFRDEHFNATHRRADMYPSEVLYGVYLLAMRDFAPLSERLLLIKDRLEDTPRLLEEGAANLRNGDNIPGIWTNLGITMANSGLEFLSTLVPELVLSEKVIEKSLLRANQKAIEALRSYRDCLENDVVPRSSGNFAIGERAFNYLLKYEHHLPYEANDIRLIGVKTIEETQSKLAELASRIAPRKTWQEVVADLKNEHPLPADLLDAYREEMDRARRFVEDNGLVTIPPDQNLVVTETPAFERPTVPYAAFIPPAPFEDIQEGIFWVTPVDPEAPPSHREDQLKGHSNWGIPITALHEAYPGHHLQFCHANRVESMVRRQFSTSVFVEGWALYCELMMQQEGFITDPRHMLLLLKDQLWRACRVVIDVGLHCSGMGVDEAVAMLVNVAGLERSNAESEVRRYSLTPTQPMSYLIGRHQIMQLRRQVQNSMGDSFVLRDFHDKLLSYGSIPVTMVTRGFDLL